MQDIKNYFCPHPECKHYGLRGSGNLVKAGTYTLKATGEKKQMLKCMVCGMRFSETQNDLFAGYHYGKQTIQSIIVNVAGGNSIRATAKKLGLSKDRVGSVVLKAWAYTDIMLLSLLHSLHLKEDQLDDFWLFVQKNIRRKSKNNN